jgi:hypothetical protein
MQDLEERKLGTDELDAQTVTELVDRHALSVITPMAPLCRGLGLLDALTGGHSDIMFESEDGETVVESSSDDGSAGQDHVLAVAVNHGRHAVSVASVDEGDDVTPHRHIVWPCSPVYARPHNGPVA